MGMCGVMIKDLVRAFLFVGSLALACRDLESANTCVERAAELLACLGTTETVMPSTAPGAMPVA